MENIKIAADYIRSKITNIPEIGLVLGSGLGGLADRIEDRQVIKYEEIPSFPISTVEGHAGQLVFGKLSGKNVVAMQGRFHYYEGYKIDDVVLPIRVLSNLGIESLIVTNAAGGVDLDYKPGDLMLINDHINYTGVNPLIGPNKSQLGPRFLDMSNAYDKEYMDIAIRIAGEMNIDLKSGVYMWFSGPTYETPSEVRLARTLGADAVGMSTVPEVIVARHEDIRVLGISCITNMAAGILDAPLVHDEVVETSLKVKEKFESLVIEILKKL